MDALVRLHFKPILTLIALINANLHSTPLAILIAQTVEVVEIRFALCAVPVDVFLAVGVTQFALFQWVQKVQALAVETIPLCGEGLAVDVLVLAFVGDGAVALSALEALVGFVLEAVLVACCALVVFHDIIGNTLETFIVVILQTVLDRALLVACQLEGVFALFAVDEVVLETAGNVALVLPLE